MRKQRSNDIVLSLVHEKTQVLGVSFSHLVDHSALMIASYSPMVRQYYYQAISVKIGKAGKLPSRGWPKKSHEDEREKEKEPGNNDLRFLMWPIQACGRFICKWSKWVYGQYPSNCWPFQVWWRFHQDHLARTLWHNNVLKRTSKISGKSRGSSSNIPIQLSNTGCTH